MSLRTKETTQNTMAEFIPDNLQAQESQQVCHEELSMQTQSSFMVPSPLSAVHILDSPAGPLSGQLDNCMYPDQGKENRSPAVVVMKADEETTQDTIAEFIPDNLQAQESQQVCHEESSMQTQSSFMVPSLLSVAHILDSPAGPLLGQLDNCMYPDQGKEDRSPAVVVMKVDEAAKLSKDAGTLQGEREETETLPAHRSIGYGCTDVAELSCPDLRSPRSDAVSLASEAAISGKSDEQEFLEDDTQSVTASSITSLFQRLQMDPLERDWLLCAATGNTPALQQLLQQDPTLASRKTALHWAAKQGRLETVDMMAGAGADVNLRSGYTALHLAALHGHRHVIQLLVNNYNARTNIRDYHGKMAVHYWTGSTDVFNKPGSQSGGKWSTGRRGQWYTQLPSLLMSRSRSHGHLNMELAPTPQDSQPLSRARGFASPPI